MSTRVLFIQHQDDCPPGYVGERLEQHGAELDVVRAQQGTLPDPAGYDLIVPLGSDDSAYDTSLPYLDAEWELLSAAVSANVPVFGICFGAQLLSRVLGGHVLGSPNGPEIGWIHVETNDSSLIESGPWLSWHLDVMNGAPPGGEEIARTDAGTHAFVHGQHLGTQFHPEATVDSADTWASHYPDSLTRLGLDRAQLLAEAQAEQPHARLRAHTLTDRVMRRAGVALHASSLS